MTSHSFCTGEEPLESILCSIKEKIQQLGPDIQWKVDIAPLSRENSPINNTIPTEYPWGNEPVSEFYKYHLGLEEQLEKLYHNLSQCEKKLCRQSTQIIKTETEARLTHSAMKNIYLLKCEEDKLRHLNQLRNHEISIERLKQHLGNLNTIIKTIDKVNLPLKDLELDREKLLVDRLHILRKLKVAELRLEIRDVELSAMRSLQQTVYSKNQPMKEHISTHKPAPVTYNPHALKIDGSMYNITSVVSKKTPLISLSTLADGLLKTSQQTKDYALTDNSLRLYEPQPTHVYEKRRFSMNSKDKRPKAIKLTYKDQWSPNDDDILLKKAKKFGTNQWDHISKTLPYRTDRLKKAPPSN